jgi:hypothetical protein
VTKFEILAGLLLFILMIEVNKIDFNHHPPLRRWFSSGYQTPQTERLVSGARPEPSPYLRLQNFLLSHPHRRHRRRRRCQSRRDCRRSERKLKNFVNFQHTL